jgi:hypothetical protein
MPPQLLMLRPTVPPQALPPYKLSFLLADAVALDLPAASFDRCFSLLGSTYEMYVLLGNSHVQWAETDCNLFLTMAL